MVSSSVMGAPWAVPLAPPKLLRMSLRTMPLCSSTSGPFEPSPGYGPAVSSGISPDAAVADDEGVDEPVPRPHAAKPSAVRPTPNTRSTCRRPIRVPRSKPRPWSTTSSSGLTSGRPSYIRPRCPSCRITFSHSRSGGGVATDSARGLGQPAGRRLWTGCGRRAPFRRRVAPDGPRHPRIRCVSTPPRSACAKVRRQ
jgi:hypothetical protein